MKSAIGNSLLLTIVIIIVSAVILLFVSVLSYSKAYRVKNGIIEIIERNNGYNVTDSEGNNVTEKETDNFLYQSGYKVGKNNNCANVLINKGVDEVVNTSSNYNYCVGKTNSKNGGSYYTVITYVEFDFPVIGSMLSFPVSGETKILNRNYTND